MAHRDVLGVFPPFQNPDHFKGTVAGRYVCTLCPAPWDNIPITYKTDKEALAHERSEGHQCCVGLERDNPWGEDIAQNSADWRSAPSDSEKGAFAMLRNQEYRGKYESIPEVVEKWRTGFIEYAQQGQMLGPDEREPSKHALARRRRAATKKSSSNLPLVVSSPPDAASMGSSSDEHSEPRQARWFRPISQTRRHPHTSPAPPPCMPSPFPVPDGRRRAFFAQTLRTLNSEPINITPELRDWMNRITIDLRFSPTKTRQMQEFIQLPTETKVDIIRHSVDEVRTMLFT